MSTRRRFGGLGLGMGLGGGGGVVIDPDAQTFIDRVLADGGTVEDASFLNSFVLDAKANNYWTDIVAAYSPSWGVKGTTSASKLYCVNGAATDIEQTTGADQPAITSADLSGKTRLTFDGVNHKFTPKAFTFSQPETVILGGLQQTSWTLNDHVYDGFPLNSMAMFQVGVTPTLEIYAGSSVGTTTEVLVGGDHHCRSFYNASGTIKSQTQVDGNAAITGNTPGATNAGGFTLGSASNGGFQTHMKVGMVVLLNSAEDANYDAKMTALYNFSKSAYGTA